MPKNWRFVGPTGEELALDGGAIELYTATIAQAEKSQASATKSGSEVHSAGAHVLSLTNLSKRIPGAITRWLPSGGRALFARAGNFETGDSPAFHADPNAVIGLLQYMPKDEVKRVDVIAFHKKDAPGAPAKMCGLCRGFLADYLHPETAIIGAGGADNVAFIIPWEDYLPREAGHVNFPGALRDDILTAGWNAIQASEPVYRKDIPRAAGAFGGADGNYVWMPLSGYTSWSRAPGPVIQAFSAADLDAFEKARAQGLEKPEEALAYVPGSFIFIQEGSVPRVTQPQAQAIVDFVNKKGGKGYPVGDFPVLTVGIDASSGNPELIDARITTCGDLLPYTFTSK
ncbi:MAG: hypothetical protein V1820_00590 [archaeon]